RAITAIQSGILAEEIVPVEVKGRKGSVTVVDQDEAPRADTTIEKLTKLKSVFNADGTITAGNAPGVNDGAAALVLMSEERAKKESKTPLATILAHAAISVEAKDFPKTPGLVINELLKKTEKTVDEIDLFEINEAFDAVALTSGRIANLDPEKVNVNGRAVAHGNTIGACCARINITLIIYINLR